MSEGDIGTVPAETNDKAKSAGEGDLSQLSAEELKNKANEHFRKKEYDDAIKLYSKGIDKDPKNHILYGNRSFAYLKTECFGYAYLDASRAIELDNNYIKGYYRRAEAQMANGKFKEALKDLQTVIKFCPRDQDAKGKYTECKKIVSQKAFEKVSKKFIYSSLTITIIFFKGNFRGRNKKICC